VGAALHELAQPRLAGLHGDALGVLGRLEQKTGIGSALSSYSEHRWTTPTSDARQVLGHRTACAICRRVLLPAALVSVAHATDSLDASGYADGWGDHGRCVGRP